MNLGEMFGGLSRRSAVLIALTVGFGLLHHIDHVLRVDHSRWPFRPDVNPFTFKPARLPHPAVRPVRAASPVLDPLGTVVTWGGVYHLRTQRARDPWDAVHNVGPQPQQRPARPRLAQHAWRPIPGVRDGGRHRCDGAQHPTGNRVPVDALGWP